MMATLYKLSYDAETAHPLLQIHWADSAEIQALGPLHLGETYLLNALSGTLIQIDCYPQQQQLGYLLTFRLPQGHTEAAFNWRVQSITSESQLDLVAPPLPEPEPEPAPVLAPSNNDFLSGLDFDLSAPVALPEPEPAPVLAPSNNDFLSGLDFDLSAPVALPEPEPAPAAAPSNNDFLSGLDFDLSAPVALPEPEPEFEPEPAPAAAPSNNDFLSGLDFDLSAPVALPEPEPAPVLAPSNNDFLSGLDFDLSAPQLTPSEPILTEEAVARLQGSELFDEHFLAAVSASPQSMPDFLLDPIQPQAHTAPDPFPLPEQTLTAPDPALSFPSFDEQPASQITQPTMAAEPTTATTPQKAFSGPYQAGMTIHHSSYGTGVVHKVMNVDGSTILNVVFDVGGKRLIDPALAPLSV